MSNFSGDISLSQKAQESLGKIEEIILIKKHLIFNFNTNIKGTKQAKLYIFLSHSHNKNQMSGSNNNNNNAQPSGDKNAFEKILSEQQQVVKQQYKETTTFIKDYFLPHFNLYQVKHSKYLQKED